jgi:hypothetical protein
MELTPCKKCGYQQKKRAYKCISCGKLIPNASKSEWGLYIFLAYITLGMIITVWPQKTAQNLTRKVLQPSNAAAQNTLDYIKDLNWVKDAIYQDHATIQWHVGILDNGRHPYGTAQAICDMLRLRGLVNETTRVRVVDIKKISRGETFREASLGRVHCTTRETSYP